MHGANDMRLYDEPVPTPGQGVALVRVTHRFPLGQVTQAYAVGHRREEIKIVIEP